MEAEADWRGARDDARPGRDGRPLPALLDDEPRRSDAAGLGVRHARHAPAAARPHRDGGGVAGAATPARTPLFDESVSGGDTMSRDEHGHARGRSASRSAPSSSCSSSARSAIRSCSTRARSTRSSGRSTRSTRPGSSTLPTTRPRRCSRSRSSSGAWQSSSTSSRCSSSSRSAAPWAGRSCGRAGRREA